MKKIFSFLLLISIAFMVGCATLQCQSEQNGIDNDKEKQYVEDESIK
ncbi:MAG: hypothetical protein PHR82_07180 [Endomicrobiaceae bacterium]|nr:hypothetical protein [Endomicrobiaceae bacterium]